MNKTTLSIEHTIDAFAKWKHPEEAKAQTILKYDCAAVLADLSLVGVISSIALACFSGFAALGLVLTITFVATYFQSAAAATNANDAIDDDGAFEPIAYEIPIYDEIKICWFRCYAKPEKTEPPATVESYTHECKNARN